MLVIGEEQALLGHRAEPLVRLPRVSPGHRRKAASPERGTMALSVLCDSRGLSKENTSQ